MTSLPVVVVGAGPYGLSVAAHVKSFGRDVRVFGEPMGTWQQHMPEGMFLKSEPWASNLSDPAGYATLRQFCHERSIPYRSEGWPLPVSTFVEYGRWFQHSLVPDVERERVELVTTKKQGFRLDLQSGEQIEAGRVVVAAGLSSFARMPSTLAKLPQPMRSHTSEHRAFTRFAGRHVTVVGGGQSALESAALLHEAGARVQLVARHPIVWPPMPADGPRGLRERLAAPSSGLGCGWKAYAAANCARPFRHLAGPIRREIVRRALGPAGSWWLRERFVGHVPVLAPVELGDISARSDGACSHGSPGRRQAAHDRHRSCPRSDGLPGRSRCHHHPRARASRSYRPRRWCTCARREVRVVRPGPAFRRHHGCQHVRAGPALRVRHGLRRTPTRRGGGQRWRTGRRALTFLVEVGPMRRGAPGTAGPGPDACRCKRAAGDRAGARPARHDPGAPGRLIDSAARGPGVPSGRLFRRHRLRAAGHHREPRRPPGAELRQLGRRHRGRLLRAAGQAGDLHRLRHAGAGRLPPGRRHAVVGREPRPEHR